jgi:hypothetical protein
MVLAKTNSKAVSIHNTPNANKVYFFSIFLASLPLACNAGIRMFRVRGVQDFFSLL